MFNKLSFVVLILNLLHENCVLQMLATEEQGKHQPVSFYKYK